MTISQPGATSITNARVTSGDIVNAYSIPVQISGSSTAIPNTKGSTILPTVTKTILVTTASATSSNSTQSFKTALVIITSATNSSSAQSSKTTLATGTINGSSTQPSGLSTEGKAGICVGILFGIAIIFLIGLCWGKKRRRTQGHTRVELPTDHRVPAILSLS